MPRRTDDLRQTIYVELVHSLFATIVPTLIMSVAFTLSAALIHIRLQDPLLMALGLAGIVASITRVAVVLKCRRDAARYQDRAHARMMERWFGASYLAFALCLGAFGARVFMLASVEAHMLTICLLVGYCAGVAAVVGLRPLIAVPAMAVAILPAITVAAFNPDVLYWVLSGTAASLLAGGSYSVLVRHRATQAEIGKRISFASLARHDGLTELPNRLALREWFDAHVGHGPRERAVAVHYIDLDGFKPVNDRYGHPVGDALLRAVAGRLTHCLRAGDIAARLGGDEFAIIQRDLGHVDEAQLLSHRLASAVKQPFRIGEHDIRISACIGTVTSTSRTDDLERLLAEADEALYTAKRGGHIVTRRSQNSIAA
ncbi:GGDEF domain-containing protein [Sphingomonas colocasiae]|uniref:GGDEF domain-containing protein n=1 Tax=Sphingomonas colocasiae TaxID=1848973 RepID=UPI001FE7D788|nr:GGDEF domain-containing protein [Sphingomonas colocasiae]